MQRLKIIGFLAVLLFNHFSGYSQLDEVEQKDPENEIGVNMLPFVLAFGGAWDFQAEHQIFYKRNSENKKWAFRTGFGAIMNPYGNWWTNEYEVLGFTDSTETRLYNWKNPKPLLNLSAGC